MHSQLKISLKKLCWDGILCGQWEHLVGWQTFCGLIQSLNIHLRDLQKFLLSQSKMIREDSNLQAEILSLLGVCVMSPHSQVRTVQLEDHVLLHHCKVQTIQ